MKPVEREKRARSASVMKESSTKTVLTNATNWRRNWKSPGTSKQSRRRQVALSLKV